VKAATTVKRGSNLKTGSRTMVAASLA